MNPDTTPQATPAPAPEYLRPGPMASAMGVSRVTLYRLSARAGFPAAVRLSSRCTLFPRAAVLAWMGTQAQAA